MPWQFGQLGLTEDHGNRLLKYADVILDGASPNDGKSLSSYLKSILRCLLGFAIYKNQSSVWNIFTYVLIAVCLYYPHL